VENYETDFVITAHELEADGARGARSFVTEAFRARNLPQRESRTESFWIPRRSGLRTIPSSTMESPRWHSPSRSMHINVGRIGSMSWDYRRAVAH